MSSVLCGMELSMTLKDAPCALKPHHLAARFELETST